MKDKKFGVMTFHDSALHYELVEADSPESLDRNLLGRSCVVYGYDTGRVYKNQLGCDVQPLREFFEFYSTSEVA